MYMTAYINDNISDTLNYINDIIKKFHLFHFLLFKWLLEHFKIFLKDTTAQKIAKLLVQERISGFA